MQSLFRELRESSACGVGFVASRINTPSHDILQQGLHALACVEHRGACAYDAVSGDGAGVMTDIPFKLLGYEKGKVAVGSLFAPTDPFRRRQALSVFEDTFNFFGLTVLSYRDVPVNHRVLGALASESAPAILQAIIERPTHCSTGFSFDQLLYEARQMLRSKMREKGFVREFFFTSLSSKTIVYKGMLKSTDLAEFYSDLLNPEYMTRFTLFHRRFSTNTHTSWDKAQPFRLMGHNGEINTIAGNRSWAYSREKNLGVRKDELLTHSGLSDSGNLNEMVAALRFRSSIPDLEDILALLVPPFGKDNSFYEFWSRAMEPWDGPALIAFSDGRTIGARLDRNGFRPCRWFYTPRHFYLSSEAGTFDVAEKDIQEKGTLRAGSGIVVGLQNGGIFFRDPSESIQHWDVKYDSRLWPLPDAEVGLHDYNLDKQRLFLYSKEDLDKVLFPMILTAKEPIGSMGDTASLAVLSDLPRTLFDFFYHDFAQVTNPPLDFLREKVVTDLSVFLGRRPNIFKPKQMVPLPPAFRLESPVLSLEKLAYLRAQARQRPELETRTAALEIEMTFRREFGSVGLQESLDRAGKLAVEASKNHFTILILTDRRANPKNPPVPSLLMLRAVIGALNATGNRLKMSVVVESGEIRATHHVAALIGFGATAVCPWMALQIARSYKSPKLAKLSGDQKQKNLIHALEQGLLKIMSKSGISVVRSYQSSKLFTALGLGPKILKNYFHGLFSPVGGLELRDLSDRILRWAPVSREELEAEPFETLHRFREHPAGKKGERHSMTTQRSKLIHKLSELGAETSQAKSIYEEYLELGKKDEPITLRHLLDLRSSAKPLELSEVESQASILKRFGSGAMSFGAISAESQRDIILAMREIGGRANSGEGGENPYYETDGIYANVKQVASGRFGVTARFLVSSDEIQIKIAQGAKPGEGGQLMGIKVSEGIAKARFSKPGVDLISPPPLHDIYSIEDLKQLIYELKQVHPGVKVNVKLVAGANIGTVAVGVAKAGANIIHVSGGEGGTGAASLSSMNHCGLPWELGLLEVHRALSESKLRNSVVLRADGGLSSGADVLKAAILGAQEFEFGKLLLIAEGCVMARVCEKNICPTGIATHNDKFKAKYKGSPQKIIRVLQLLADDIRSGLARCGAKSLHDLVGRVDALKPNPNTQDILHDLNLDLSRMIGVESSPLGKREELFPNPIHKLNARILDDTNQARKQNEDFSKTYAITNTDRAIPATLAGNCALDLHQKHLQTLQGVKSHPPYERVLNLRFKGSAGQGFGVFLTKEIQVRLEGEGNDSVCKAMSGGRMVIVPPDKAPYDPEKSVILGHCALYGATGGTLYVRGIAGDRFAVRNSGAIAVVEGVGLHGCEYMTGGTVIILGSALANVGAGMTGGQLFAFESLDAVINPDYLAKVTPSSEDLDFLEKILGDYAQETQSKSALEHLSKIKTKDTTLHAYLPKNLLEG
jgi:glutamate synthase domain-containing protein 2/glutamate synthase domain-containing protein 1/glutamate synthase domain-containing protein 3